MVPRRAEGANPAGVRHRKDTLEGRLYVAALGWKGAHTGSAPTESCPVGSVWVARLRLIGVLYHGGDPLHRGGDDLYLGGAVPHRGIDEPHRGLRPAYRGGETARSWKACGSTGRRSTPPAAKGRSSILSSTRRGRLWLLRLCPAGGISLQRGGRELIAGLVKDIEEEGTAARKRAGVQGRRCGRRPGSSPPIPVATGGIAALRTGRIVEDFSNRLALFPR
jgi:hypothetical protein